MFVDAAHNKLTQRVASRVYNRDAMMMSDFFGHFLRIDYCCTAGRAIYRIGSRQRRLLRESVAGLDCNSACGSGRQPTAGMDAHLQSIYVNGVSLLDCGAKDLSRATVWCCPANT